MSIFKAYDIRGLVPSELDADLAYRIGRAAARFLGARRVVIGRDARTHSPELGEALVRGVREEGASVLDIGLAATPMLYFATDALDADGGIMLTASHNPAQYNGMKICGRSAVPVGEATGLREIELLAADPGAPRSARGGREAKDIVDAYVRHVLAVGTETPAPLRVAIDCANGMAAVGLEPLLARLPLRTERLYFEPDGRFPNHPADPLKVENLRDVAQAVRGSGAAFGVAFDGDADRAIFVDERGAPVPSDLMTGLLAKAQLARRGAGGTVLYDLRSSWATADAIREAGGTPQMCRVGHSFVKAQMRETSAVFAGELSGHFYFRFSDRLVADDGIAAFVALVDALSRAKQPLSALIAPLRRYHASGEINRHVEDPKAIIEAVAREHAGAREISRLDGLLVRYDDWWFNLRPSNTEPLLRLNLEAKTAERMIGERDRMLARMGGHA